MKKKIFSLILIMLMSITPLQSANVTDIKAKNVFDIANSEFTLDKTPKLSYVIYGFTSLDKDAPDEFKETKQYIENYSIEFVYPEDVSKQKSHTANVISSGTIDIMNEDTITIPTSEISELGTMEIVLPIKTGNEKKEILSLSEEGIKSVLRNISVNVFYTNPDYNELDKIKNNDYSVGNAHNTMFVQKSNVAEGAITLDNERKDYHRMYAAIYVTDEYSGGQKRQSFEAYHSKYSPLNKLVDGMAYISTFKNDTRPDVIALGWGLGGAIGMYDPSIDLLCAYNLQCENCLLNGYNNYAYNNFTRYSSEVSMHDILFSGQSIGFNIPDIGISQCKNCLNGIRTRPAALNINAKSGWYNIGGYDGTDGEVRTEYYHTYNSKTLSLTPSVRFPLSISFTPNLVEHNDYERTWVYTTVSPN